MNDLANAETGMSGHLERLIVSQEVTDRKLASLAATVETYSKGLRNGG